MSCGTGRRSPPPGRTVACVTDRTAPPARVRAARALAIAAAAAVALIAPLAAAAPAAAHSSLVSTTPESGSGDATVVETLPEEVSLTFSDDLTPPQQAGDGSTAIAVYDETCEDAALLIADPGRADTRDCRDYAVGDPTVDGPTVTQAIDVADAPSGTYTVVWRVLYGDGHPDSQMFTFVAEQAATDAPQTPQPLPTDTAAPAAPESDAPATDEAASDADATPSPGPADETEAPADEGAPTGLLLGIAGAVIGVLLLALAIFAVVRARRGSGGSTEA